MSDITTARALEVVLSRCKLDDRTARALMFHLDLARRDARSDRDEPGSPKRRHMADAGRPYEPVICEDHASDHDEQEHRG